MRVEITDPGLVDDLADALRRCEFRVAQSSPTTLAVKAEDPPPGIKPIPGASELELDLYLRLWETRHPGVRAKRLAE